MSSEANGVARPADTSSVKGEAYRATETPTIDPPLSKNQLKKLKKKQEWEDGREQRKVHRKEKDKARKERRREEIIQQITAEEEAAASGANIPATLDADGNPQDPTAARAPKLAGRKHAGLPGSQQVPVTFIFDCDFDDLMLETELTSLGSQLTRCYSDNRKGTFRAHLAVSSYGKRLKERFDGVLEGQHKNWKGFRVCEEDFVSVAEQAKVWMRSKGGGKVVGAIAQDRVQEAEDAITKGSEDATSKAANVQGGKRDVVVTQDELPSEETQDGATEQKALSTTETFNTTEAPSTREVPSNAPEDLPDGEVIYLTADSPNTLTTLSPYSTYIIGGIIDRNRHKGICYKRAQERGIKTAKLPIGEYLEMASRQVLATNHVNEIMVKWLEEGDWGRAFMSVIPKRKGGVLKGEGLPKGKTRRQKQAQSGKSEHPLAEDFDYSEEEEGGVPLDSGEENVGLKDISVKAEEFDRDLKAVEEDTAALNSPADETRASVPDEPVTADDQVDIAAKEGQVYQAANLKRRAPEADDHPEDLKKKVKSLLDS
jgi:tRNA (guanine9-N1)-methyltransferase